MIYIYIQEVQFRHCHLTFIGFVIVEKKECSIKHAQISGVQTAVRCNAANSTTHRGPLSFIVRRVESEREREKERESLVQDTSSMGRNATAACTVGTVPVPPPGYEWKADWLTLLRVVISPLPSIPIQLVYNDQETRVIGTLKYNSISLSPTICHATNMFLSRFLGWWRKHEGKMNDLSIELPFFYFFFIFTSLSFWKYKLFLIINVYS